MPPAGPESIIGGFAEAAKKLAMDRDLRARLGAAGRRRVESLFDWNRKVDRILEIYRQAIGEFPRLLSRAREQVRRSEIDDSS